MNFDLEYFICVPNANYCFKYLMSIINESKIRFFFVFWTDLGRNRFPIEVESTLHLLPFIVWFSGLYLHFFIHKYFYHFF